MVSTDHSAAEDVDCHSAAGMVDVAGSGCAEGTGHDSPDWVVLGTSIGSLAEGWCMDEYYSQRPIPKVLSFWHPSPCAYCQSQ